MLCMLLEVKITLNKIKIFTSRAPAVALLELGQKEKQNLKILLICWQDICQVEL